MFPTAQTVAPNSWSLSGGSLNQRRAYEHLCLSKHALAGRTDRTSPLSGSSRVAYGDCGMADTGTVSSTASTAEGANGEVVERTLQELVKGPPLENSCKVQAALLTWTNFSIIATDEKGIIQLFNV